MPISYQTNNSNAKTIAKKVGSFATGFVSGFTGIPLPKMKFDGYRDDTHASQAGKINLAGDITGKIVMTATTMGAGAGVMGAQAGAKAGVAGAKAGAQAGVTGAKAAGTAGTLGAKGAASTAGTVGKGAAGTMGTMGAKGAAGTMGTAGKVANSAANYNKFIQGMDQVSSLVNSTGLGDALAKIGTDKERFKTTYQGPPGSLSPATKTSGQMLSPTEPEIGLAEGGSVDGSGWIIGGSGNPKADDIRARLPKDAFVIPHPYSNDFASSDDARRLGLNGLAMGGGTANTNAPGGVPAKVSSNEFLLSGKKVSEAKALGIDLQKWAPNATEMMAKPRIATNMTEPMAGNRSVNRSENPVFAGSRGINRTDEPVTLQDGVKLRPEQQLRFKHADHGLYDQNDLYGLYSKRTPTADERVLNRYRGATKLGTAYDMATTAALLIQNMRRKPGELPGKQVHQPLLYNRELDVSDQQGDIENAYQTGLYQSRAMGSNPYAMLPAMFASKLQALQKLGAMKANYRSDVDNKNTDVKNTYGQARNDADYEHRVGNKLYKDQFYKEKAGTTSQLLTAGSQTFENRRNAILDETTLKYILKQI